MAFLKLDMGWDGATRLQGEGVVLRAPRPADYDAWASLRLESEAWLRPWEPEWAPDELSREGWRRRLRRYVDDMKADRAAPFFILSETDETLLGGINLNGIQRGVAQTCSVGYWIGAPHARQGHMRAALRLLIPWAFDRLGLHRVEAACLPENERSSRLLLSVGFSPEGRSRAYLKINGAWADHLRFAIVKGDPVL